MSVSAAYRLHLTLASNGDRSITRSIGRPSAARTHAVISDCSRAKSATTVSGDWLPDGTKAGSVRVRRLLDGASSFQTIQPTTSRRYLKTRHFSPSAASCNPARISGSAAVDVMFRCAMHSAGDHRAGPGRCCHAS